MGENVNKHHACLISSAVLYFCSINDLGFNLQLEVLENFTISQLPQTLNILNKAPSVAMAFYYISRGMTR